MTPEWLCGKKANRPYSEGVCNEQEFDAYKIPVEH